MTLISHLRSISSTAKSGAAFVDADPAWIGDASTAGTGPTISGENLMTGSGPGSDSICAELRICGGEAEEFVRVLLTPMSSSADAKDDVPGTNPGGKLVTGEDEALEVELAVLVEEGECVERVAAASSKSIGSEAEKVKLAGGGGNSGIKPGGGARPEVSIWEADPIVEEGPWMAARVSRSVVNIWERRGADTSCTIEAGKAPIWDEGSMRCVSARVSMWISRESRRLFGLECPGGPDLQIGGFMHSCGKESREIVKSTAKRDELRKQTLADCNREREGGGSEGKGK